MLFHSLPFLVFFVFYFALHLLVPLRFRLWFIIIGGTVFYGWWNPYLVWLPHSLALIAWAGARWFSAASGKMRKTRFILTLAALLTPLLLFKYANFIALDVLHPLLGWPHAAPLSLPLPLGISFVTFTMMAYVADVYRGAWPLERRGRMIVAYMVFFPHLIAGPILRPHEIIPQLDRPRNAAASQLALGVLIFTAGLVKKLLFADQLGPAVDAIYASVAPLSALDALLAIYGFTLQIYCDFSGYTDMAIGLACMLGVRLPNNFDKPYISHSIAEFWRRWHLTLSRWLRDYIYIPLGGNRHGLAEQVRNVMITMALGGLWHGASWTFVLWGVLHGVGISITYMLRALRIELGQGRLARSIRVLVTFHIVALLWVLFRARSLASAHTLFTGLFHGTGADSSAFLAKNGFYIMLFLIFIALHRFDSHGMLRLLRRKVKAPILWTTVLLLWIMAIVLNTGSSAQFIYFDF